MKKRHSIILVSTLVVVFLALYFLKILSGPVATISFFVVKGTFSTIAIIKSGSWIRKKWKQKEAIMYRWVTKYLTMRWLTKIPSQTIREIYYGTVVFSCAVVVVACIYTIPVTTFMQIPSAQASNQALRETTQRPAIAIETIRYNVPQTIAETVDDENEHQDSETAADEEVEENDE